MPNPSTPAVERVRGAQQARRNSLVERLGTFADMLSSYPLEGDKGDVAYDLLRQAAAQIASDAQRLDLTTPSTVRAEALEEAVRVADAYADSDGDLTRDFNKGFELSARKIARRIRTLLDSELRSGLRSLSGPGCTDGDASGPQPDSDERVG